MKLAYCQSTFKPDFEQTKECIARMSPYVDIVIISYDQSLDESQIKWLNNNKDEYKIYPVKYQWEDNMPQMRNSYLEKAKELGIDFIAVSDPDELYSVDLAKNLRRLIERYNSQGYNMLGINCRDQFSAVNWLDKLDMVKECPGGYNETDFWKPILIFKISGDTSDIHYEGVGTEKTVHETIVTKGSLRSFNIPKTEKIPEEEYTEEYKNINKNYYEYYYIHKKSALKIWRNAARNMFLSGGGDNVGSLNQLWRSDKDINITLGEDVFDAFDEPISGLRNITDNLEITNWYQFESFIIKGIFRYKTEKEREIKLSSHLSDSEKNEKIKFVREQLSLFENWLVAALQAGANNYQTETRETAKWFFALHVNELDDLILHLIEHPPEPTEDTEIENFVTKTYFQILGRHPDAQGREGYVKQIKSGKIDREDLPKILQESDEYKRRFPYDIDKKNKDEETINKEDDITSISSPFPNQNEIEKIVINVYKNVLNREPDQSGMAAYVDHIKFRRIKSQEQLENILMDSQEYKRKKKLQEQSRKETRYDDKDRDDESFSQNSSRQFRGPPSPFLKIPQSKSVFKNIDDIDSSKFNTVALCIMGYSDVVPMMVKSIEIIGRECDEIHVQGDNFTDKDIKTFNEIGKKIEKDINIHIVLWKDDFSDYKNKACGWARTEWDLILDHDEVPTPEMAKRLKEIIVKSDRGNNFDIVSFDAIDIHTEKDQSGNEKIIYQNRHKGGKQLLHWNIMNPYFGRLHIWLKQDYYPWKTIHAPVPYQHIKNKDEILERSARNVWMGGGGDTVEHKNPLWGELRDISKELGFEKWKDFKEYCKKGNIDIRLLNVFLRMSEIEWKDDELKDLLKYYTMLHPEEVKKKELNYEVDNLF